MYNLANPYITQKLRKYISAQCLLNVLNLVIKPDY